jgi:hypothetical protein
MVIDGGRWGMFAGKEQATCQSKERENRASVKARDPWGVNLVLEAVGEGVVDPSV